MTEIITENGMKIEEARSSTSSSARSHKEKFRMTFRLRLKLNPRVIKQKNLN